MKFKKLKNILNYTEEQKSIASVNLRAGEIVKVKAFAGTGKTTTLRALAEANPQKKMLYIAFNSSVAKEARKKFPFNVECRTSHSLAYAEFGYSYKNKLSSTVRPHEIMKLLNIDSYGYANYLIGVVKKFCASDDNDINENHLIVTEESAEEYKLRKRKEEKDVDLIIDQAKTLWKLMIDKNSAIPTIHDIYLKLYQLSKPKLDNKYDVLLLDEAQDTTPCVMDIFKNQNCCRVLVGDDHQNIYTFRGAKNALTFSANTEKYLRQSFRFGQVIADAANDILILKKEKEKIIGTQKKSVINRVDVKKPFAILSRTNGYLFDEAVKHLHIKGKFGFIGTYAKDNYSPLNAYKFQSILDIYFLSTNNKFSIKNQYIKSFNHYGEFLKTVNDPDAPDIELKSCLNIVQRYGASIPNLITEICKKCVDPKNAFIKFSTAHKAKGMEFDQVKLTDDYLILVESVELDEGAQKVFDTASGTVKEERKCSRINKLAPDLEEKEEEINLLYVAITRAKRVLELNDKTREYFKYIKNKSE